MGKFIQHFIDIWNSNEFNVAIKNICIIEYKIDSQILSISIKNSEYPQLALYIEDYDDAVQIVPYSKMINERNINAIEIRDYEDAFNHLISCISLYVSEYMKYSVKDYFRNNMVFGTIPDVL